ncbi:hypothetical protein [Desulfoluna sp.]|uniref:hypothetical protein n=1 Tax=Desulfoluna sp. TaxID=2045199 RepID=UPI0026332A49|nr:hypothetical protein [Desulfoluna sp.]
MRKKRKAFLVLRAWCLVEESRCSSWEQRITDGGTSTFEAEPGNEKKKKSVPRSSFLVLGCGVAVLHLEKRMIGHGVWVLFVVSYAVRTAHPTFHIDTVTKGQTLITVSFFIDLPYRCVAIGWQKPNSDKFCILYGP